MSQKESDEIGAGSYIVRFRFGDKRPIMGLGAFGEISLKDAREAALAAVRLARSGSNPIEERRRRQAANLAAERAARPTNFRQATQLHFDTNAPSWKGANPSGTWLDPIVKYAYPVIGDLSLCDIEVRHIVDILTATAKDGRPETGRRIRTRIERILDGAMARGDLDDKRRNPAAAGLVGKVFSLKRPPGERPHHPSVPFKKAQEVFRALRQAADGARWLRQTELDAWLFMIATAARPSEALEAPWAEVDLEERLWTIPAARMKSRREHVVPLSKFAVGVLERRLKARRNDVVFSGLSARIVSHSGFVHAPGNMGIDAASPHGWRTVFRVWCAKVGGVSFELAEEAIAHTQPEVVRAYLRDRLVEDRAPVMTRYADWLLGDAGAEAGVIPFPKRA